MPRDFSVINGIYQELRDVELALDRLHNSYDLINDRWRDLTSKVRCYAEFKVRTQRVKELRDNAWRWLKENNLQIEQHRELERGEEKEHNQDRQADIPIHWEAEIVRLRSEIEDAINELRRRTDKQRVKPNLPSHQIYI